MAPPRLLAVAPDGWHADPAFPAALMAFRAATEPLGGSAAVYLRAHGWSTARWRGCLDGLARPRKLRIGITLPVDAELPEDSELWTAAGVDFLHVPEVSADRPLSVWAPLALSRACHEPASARRRCHLGANWLVVSPVFATPSKPGGRPLGLLALAEAARAAPGRVLALGGIDATGAHACLAAGAVGLAAQRAAWAQTAELTALLVA